MNQTNLVPESFKKFCASVAIFTLLATSLPVGAYIALAEEFIPEPEPAVETPATEPVVAEAEQEEVLATEDDQDNDASDNKEEAGQDADPQDGDQDQSGENQENVNSDESGNTSSEEAKGLLDVAKGLAKAGVDMAKKIIGTEEADETLADESKVVVLDVVNDLFASTSTVEANVTYVAPQNDQVKVTFTKLPKNPGSLSIEEIELTPEQMEVLGVSSKIAYDITSDMTEGTFAYDLQLPLPTDAEESSKVLYVENLADIDAGLIKEVSSDKVDVVVADEVVSVTALDHFTIFVVATVVTEGESCAVEIGVGNCYSDLQLAIYAAVSGETIELKKDITTTSEIKINTPITLNGNGFTIKAGHEGVYTSGSWNNDNVLVIGGGSGTVINNVVIDGDRKKEVQGIQIYQSSATLNNVTIKNNVKAGIHVNNSTVTVNNVTTSNNSYGKSVLGYSSFGGIVVTSGALTVNGMSTHTSEGNPIRRNGGTVTDTNSQYNIQNLFFFHHRYTLKSAPATPVIASATVTNADVEVSWNSISGAASYEYVISQGATEVRTGTTTSTSTIETALANGTYEVKVRALAQSGLASGWSNSESFVIDVIPPYNFEEGHSAFIYSEVYIRANNSVDRAAFIRVPGLTSETRFNFTGPITLGGVSGYEHIQSGQWPNAIGVKQYRATSTLPVGTYEVTADYQVNGNWYPVSNSPAKLYVLGNPDFDITYPNDSRNIFRSNDSTIVRIKASDVGNVFDRVQFTVNSVNYMVDRNACDLRQEGNYVICDVTAAANWSPLAEGVYTSSVRVWNKANNHVSKISREFTIDATKPVVTNFISPAVASTTIKLSAEVTDNNGVDTVSFYLSERDSAGVCKNNLSSIRTVIGTKDSSSDVYSATINSSDLNGDYCVLVSAKDVATHNSIPLFKDVVIDNTAPTAPSIIKPTPRQWFKTAPIATEWTSVTDPSGITYQVAYAYDDGHIFGGSTCPDVSTIQGKAVSGCRDEAGTSRGHNPTTGEQGGVTVWVRAIDGAGNVSPWSSSVHYFYDAEAPVGDIVYPSNEQVVSPVSGKIVVHGTVTDNLSMNRVGVQLIKPGVSGHIQYLYHHMVNSNPGTWQVEFDAVALGLIDGRYGINLYFVDMAGNVSTKNYFFTLDATAPVAPTLTNSPVYVNLGQANNQATWSHPESGVKYEYREYLNQAEADADADGNTSSYWIQYKTSGQMSQTVGHSWTGYKVLYYRVVAIDEAGNRSLPSELGTVIIDKVRPTVSLVTPTSAGPFANSVTIQVDANDNHGLSKITANIYQGGSLIKSTFTTIGGNATGTHSAVVNLPNGNYVIRYNASDVSGTLSTTTEFPFTIADVVVVTPVATSTPTSTPSVVSSVTTFGSRAVAAVAGAVGQVLGASTFATDGDYCVDPYLTQNLGLGHNNSSEQVTRLQNFLNRFVGTALPVTGFFGPLTQQAVMTFQSTHAADILAPWGLTTPTGFVYHTTIKKINELTCDNQKEFPLTQAQQDEIEGRKALVASAPVSQTTSSAPAATGSVAGASISSKTDETVRSDDNGEVAEDTATEAAPVKKNIFQKIWGSIFGN